MSHKGLFLNRRQMLAGLGATAAVGFTKRAAGIVPPCLPVSDSASTGADDNRALIAITFDLEMSMHYPTWNQVEWNYEKGLLDDASKDYTVKAARRVKAAGGTMHDFVVGRIFEEENIDFLKTLLAEGHQLGNHTYDHVYILATRPEDIQFRFKRAPWLIDGKDARQVIIENIRLTELAMHTRLGIYPKGFRAPGGFKTGLDERPDVQLMLMSRGYEWVSTKYPAHPLTKPGEAPTEAMLEEIVNAQKAAQPYVQPSGLVEIPMSPVSDVVAMRTCRWKLSDFHRALRQGLQWVIENGAVFDLLCHPSVIGVEDPGLETIDMVLDVVKSAGDRAAIVDPEVIARRTRARHSATNAKIKSPQLTNA